MFCAFCYFGVLRIQCILPNLGVSSFVCVLPFAGGLCDMLSWVWYSARS